MNEMDQHPMMDFSDIGVLGLFLLFYREYCFYLLFQATSWAQRILQTEKPIPRKTDTFFKKFKLN